MAQATRWWSKTILVASIVAVVLMAAGAVGTRIGLWPFTLGLLMLVAGVLIALIVLVTGIVASIIVLSRGLTTERNNTLIGTAIAIAIAAFVVPRVATAFSVPPIHNIS